MFRYQRATVAEAQRIMSSMGAHSPADLRPDQLMRRVGHSDTRSYAQLFEWLEPGELLAQPPRLWAADWKAADPETFGP